MNNLQIVFTFISMSLHNQWLKLTLDPPSARSSKAAHLHQVLKLSKDQEIKQHQNKFHLSPQKALIRTTKTLLKIKPTNDANLTISHFSDYLSDDEKKRAITSFKNRKENKTNLIKKQLQLFSEINRSLQKDKIKRYQEQIFLEEQDIQATLAQHRIKRSWMTSTAGRSSKIASKRESIYTPQAQKIIISEQDEQESKRKPTLDNDGESVFDKLFPSRRFALQRRRSKGKVSPWHVSSHFT